jgi:hypothetical protein
MGNEFFGKKGEKPSEEKQKEKSSEHPNPSLSLNQSASIVSIVGGMVIRMSFASRGSDKREWLRSGLTRTGTTHLMVYLSLVCQYPGQRPLCAWFWLGEIGELQVVLLAEHHRSDRSG